MKTILNPNRVFIEKISLNLNIGSVYATRSLLLLSLNPSLYTIPVVQIAH